MSSPYQFTLLLLQRHSLLWRELFKQLSIGRRNGVATNRCCCTSRSSIWNRADSTCGSGGNTQVDPLFDTVAFQNHIVGLRFDQAHARHDFSAQTHANLAGFGHQDGEAILAARKDTDGPDTVH